MVETTTAVAPRRVIDWERIAADYQAGVKPTRVIAEEHGITHAAILKRAKRDEWTRDLNARINAKAAIEVTKRAVSKEESRVTPVTEREVIAANVALQVAVITEARKDVRQARNTVRKIWDELEALTLSAEQHEALTTLAAIERVGEDADPQKLAKAVQAIQTAIGFPNRVQAAQALSQALDRVVTLEYKVMGIRDYQPDQQPTTPNSPAEDAAWLALRDKVRQMGLLHEQGNGQG